VASGPEAWTRGRASWTSDTPESAARSAASTAGQCGRTVQAASSVQSPRPCPLHAAMAIGPSTASTISARLIAAAGRASLSPPRAPRTALSSPAADILLTSFWTVGAGNPVSSASRWADSIGASAARLPQCRAAAHIITTA